MSVCLRVCLSVALEDLFQLTQGLAKPPPVDESPFVFVDSLPQLQEMVDELASGEKERSAASASLLRPSRLGMESRKVWKVERVLKICFALQGVTR